MIGHDRGGYPRPQFYRPDWQSLDGRWDFAFDPDNRGERERWYEAFPAGRSIEVPFCYETPRSGIGEEAFCPVVWYQRSVAVRRTPGSRAVLHFEGSDYLTRLWVNGRLAGEHAGGYTRFSFDITDLLCGGENTLAVRVEDSDDVQRPRGKQRWQKESFGCWYVQTTGIWKSVWLERCPETRLERVRMTPGLEEQSLGLEWAVAARDYGPALTLRAEVWFGEALVNRMETPVLSARGKASISVRSLAVDPWGVRKWSPESPELYDVRFTLLQGGIAADTVDSYFGMREIRIDKGNILLNGRPLYQRLILDQGYWPDSHLTPPDEAALIKDIDMTLAMGYNGARKHQKIEDERYAYWCDVKGLLMWCEMPSCYQFGGDMMKTFTAQWLDVVEQHYNHPSVIVWTPVNESWGVPEVKTSEPEQRFTEAIYALTKAADPTRPVIVNDGWEHTASDIVTLHDYEEDGAVLFERYQSRKDGILDASVYHCRHRAAFADGYEYRGQPVILSEYGGAAFTGGSGESWGYGNRVKDVDAYLKRIESVTAAIGRLPWVCGYCYTQLTDVQQEVNGLLDAGRSPKADPAAIREINRAQPSGRQGI